MRAPEYQLIDKLEKLKNELENSSNPRITISFTEYHQNLLSVLKNKASEISGTKPDHDNIDLLKEVFTITLCIIDAMIQTAHRGETINEHDLESLFALQCLNHAKPKEISDIVMVVFISLWKDYRESLEKMCKQYNLPIPQDNTHLVINLNDASCPEIDAKITLFRLQETRYLLDKILHSSLEGLSQLDSIKSLPYLRHMQISDEVVKQIKQSSNQLTENLIHTIKTAQDKLRSVISEKNYPEMMTQTIQDVVAQQTRLLAQIEGLSNLLTHSRGLIDTSSTLTAQFNNITAQAMIIEIINNAQRKIKEYESLNIASVRAEFELLGTDIASSDVVATRGISTQELGVRSREESRFGVINKIANDLIAEVNHFQVFAGESKSDFDLKNYLRNLKDEMHPFDQTIKSLENTGKFSAIVQKIYAESQLCLTQLQQSHSTVVSTTTTSTATAPASSLFGASNAICNNRDRAEGLHSSSSSSEDENATNRRSNVTANHHRFRTSHRPNNNRRPNANRGSRNPGCAQQ